MLATSSSDDEEYDNNNNNKTSSFGSNTFKRPSNASQPSFITSSKFQQPSTPNNANFRKNNGFNNDDKSIQSSFSESSENLSLNNFNQRNNSNRTNNQSFNKSNHNNITRNSSFKSNSSSNTISNQGGGGGFNNPTSNSTNNSLSTPRVQHKKKGRQVPRKSGDLSSVNGDNNEEEDSDTSEYNYEAHYQNQNNNNANEQNSDDEYSNENENQTENDTNFVSSNLKNDNQIISKTSNRKHKSKNQEAYEEQEAAAAAAQAALIAQQNEALKELELHKKKLQLYVFVCRCVAYPFIAKQPTDMVRRQLKVTKQQLNQIKDNFDSFLQNKMATIEADEAFTNAVRSYYEVFLKSDRIHKMVLAGGCSATDFRDVFKNNIEKRVRSLPEIDGLSKETVLSSWMTKFDLIFRYNEDQSNSNSIASRRHSRSYLYSNSSSESILSKEQLYDMFQNILGIKKFEHQLIFNAAQVCSSL